MTRDWKAWLVWLGVLAAVTAMLVAIRDRVGIVHVTLVYLVVVQLASARGGRPLGLTLAAAAFFGLNWFFLPPTHTLRLADSENWVVLAVYVGTAIGVSALADRARSSSAPASFERFRRDQSHRATQSDQATAGAGEARGADLQSSP